MRPYPRAADLAVAAAILTIDYALVSPPVRAGAAARAAAALGAWWLCHRLQRGEEDFSPHWGDARRSGAWLAGFLRRVLLPAVLIVGGCAWVLEAWLERPILQLPSVITSREEALPFLIHGVLLAPILEELIYRGLVQPRLRRALGPAISVILSGLAFWGLHCVDRGGLGSWNQLLGGWVLAWAYERTRSLLAPTVLHALGNAILLAADLLRF
jgi:membrane protease YdiL (CAAX protease family)